MRNILLKKQKKFYFNNFTDYSLIWLLKVIEVKNTPIIHYSFILKSQFPSLSLYLYTN